MSYFGFDPFDPDKDSSPILPEYFLRISEILEGHVEELVRDRVKDIDQLRERQQKYQDDLAAKDREVEEANAERRKAEALVSKYRKEAEDIKTATVRDYLGGWDKQHYAYVIEKSQKDVPCPICGGKERISWDFDGVKALIGCPYCNPNNSETRQKRGYLPSYTKYTVEPINLSNGVFIGIRKDGSVYPATIHVSLGYFKKIIDLSGAYVSEKEAKSEANTRTEDSFNEARKRIINTLKSKGLEKYLPKDAEL